MVGDITVEIDTKECQKMIDKAKAEIGDIEESLRYKNKQCRLLNEQLIETMDRNQDYEDENRKLKAENVRLKAKCRATHRRYMRAIGRLPDNGPIDEKFNVERC